MMVYDLSAIGRAIVLEEVNNFKSVMTEVITRELKTPLNSIIGLNTCMVDTLSPDHICTKKFLKPMMQCSSFLMELINDLLDYSSQKLDTFELNISTVNMETLIAQVTEIFEINSRIRGVQVVTNISPDVPNEIATDPNRVRQILFNLISNGLKFTYDG